jgi:hypothetical protein
VATTADQDEFAFLYENADEAGLSWNGPPSVRRGIDQTWPGLRPFGCLRVWRRPP